MTPILNSYSQNWRPASIPHRLCSYNQLVDSKYYRIPRYKLQDKTLAARTFYTCITGWRLWWRMPIYKAKNISVYVSRRIHNILYVITRDRICEWKETVRHTINCYKSLDCSTSVNTFFHLNLAPWTPLKRIDIPRTTLAFGRIFFIIFDRIKLKMYYWLFAGCKNLRFYIKKKSY